MRFQILLPLGLVIVSAVAHAAIPTSLYAPADIKRRYLSTGTGVSLPSTTIPPFPTSSIIPSNISSSTSAFTAVPSGVANEFFLVVANTSTPFDGLFLQLNYDVNQEVGVLVFSEYLVFGGTTIFFLSMDGTLQALNSGEGSAYYVHQDFNSSSGFFFQNPPDILGEVSVTCELAGSTFDGDTLTCQNGARGVFLCLSRDGDRWEPYYPLRTFGADGSKWCLSTYSTDDGVIAVGCDFGIEMNDLKGVGGVGAAHKSLKSSMDT